MTTGLIEWSTSCKHLSINCCLIIIVCTTKPTQKNEESFKEFDDVLKPIKWRHVHIKFSYLTVVPKNPNKSVFFFNFDHKQPISSTTIFLFRILRIENKNQYQNQNLNGNERERTKATIDMQSASMHTHAESTQVFFSFFLNPCIRNTHKFVIARRLFVYG